MPSTMVHQREERMQQTTVPMEAGVVHRSSRRLRLLTAVALALLVLQGMGLVYLAVLLRRSVDSLIQTQVTLTDRLVRTQETMAQFTEDQETLKLLVEDQQRLFADHQAAQQQWRESLDAERRAAEMRLASLEAQMRSVTALHEEFGALLSSAESTWKNLTGELVTYRREVEAVIGAMDRQGDAGRASGAESARLPKGMTSSDTIDAVR